MQSEWLELSIKPSSCEGSLSAFRRAASPLLTSGRAILAAEEKGHPMYGQWSQFDSGYDFERFDGKPNVYIIATLPRSGSHYLGHLLFSTGMLGAPLEYFHPAGLKLWAERFSTDSPANIFARLFRRRTSPSGWFGVKAHWPQFQAISDRVNMDATFGCPKWIYTKRRDKVEQAVSLAYAKQTKSWISFHGEGREAEYRSESIRKSFRSLSRSEEAWDTYFRKKDIVPLVIEYEDLCIDPLSTVLKCFEFLGVAVDGAHVERSISSGKTPQKQMSRAKEDWIRRFRKEIGAA